MKPCISEGGGRGGFGKLTPISKGLQPHGQNEREEIEIRVFYKLREGRGWGEGGGNWLKRAKLTTTTLRILI